MEARARVRIRALAEHCRRTLRPSRALRWPPSRIRHRAETRGGAPDPSARTPRLTGRCRRRRYRVGVVEVLRLADQRPRGEPACLDRSFVVRRARQNERMESRTVGGTGPRVDPEERGDDEQPVALRLQASVGQSVHSGRQRTHLGFRAHVLRPGNQPDGPHTGGALGSSARHVRTALLQMGHRSRVSRRQPGPAFCRH